MFWSPSILPCYPKRNVLDRCTASKKANCFKKHPVSLSYNNYGVVQTSTTKTFSATFVIVLFLYHQIISVAFKRASGGWQGLTMKHHNYLLVYRCRGVARVVHRVTTAAQWAPPLWDRSTDRFNSCFRPRCAPRIKNTASGDLKGTGEGAAGEDPGGTRVA